MSLVVYFSVFAVLLHIMCDMISGGVNLFFPYGSPIGNYYIAPEYWLHFDLVLLLTAYLIFWYSRYQLKKFEITKNFNQELQKIACKTLTSELESHNS